MFETRVERSGSVTVCRYRGELDAFSATDMRASMSALARQRSVVIDLSGVQFIDSAGLNALVGGIRRIREAGGEAVVCAPRSAVHRTLLAVGFDDFVSLVPNVAEATAALAMQEAAAPVLAAGGTATATAAR